LAWAEYWYDAVGVVGDTPVGPGVRRDSPACTRLDATGDVVVAGAPPDDEDTDDNEVSPKHDGVTIQFMNCHTAATRVMISRTVAIAWASK
jgi:hypothetical protein